MNAPVKILVADDEADLGLLMKKKFRRRIRKKELDFDFVLNGKEALEALQINGSYDLLFTDINMPVMDGITLLRKLKKLQLAVKPVVISAYGDMDNIRTAMNLGAFDFVTKPINLDDLEITLNKTVGEVMVLKEGEEVKEQLHVSESKRKEAETSRKFKEQFLANMSHEIRTPMNAVVGITNLLLQKNPRYDQLRYLNIIRQSADNLLVILNDILDLSKIEAGKMELEKKAFSLQNLLENIGSMMLIKAEEKNLELHINADNQLPEALVGDPARLSQILINLMGNAIKFTPSGTVSLNAKLAAKQGDTARVLFSVKDTGIGIATDKLAAIFDSFTQADSSINRKFGGTGLGLSISRQLIELMGGELKVTSKEGEGSDFYFTILFPLADEQEFGKTAKGTAKAEQLPDIQNLRILLIEDNEFNQVVAIDTLEMHIKNVQITVAENGHKAIELLSRQPFDLLLMDIHMPEMDGYEATRHIRQQMAAPLKNIPIMAMTASATQAEIQKCFDCGMDEYISKPFEAAGLIQKIARLTQKALQISPLTTKPTPTTTIRLSKKRNSPMLILPLSKSLTKLMLWMMGRCTFGAR